MTSPTVPDSVRGAGSQTLASHVSATSSLGGHIPMGPQGTDAILPGAVVQLRRQRGSWGGYREPRAAP
ncbi:MAG: hypothetical protein M5U28_10470 [Sandaracinaceae bacterium]|nr:hypothetical protein [Sandaracinaceae bacterium]